MSKRITRIEFTHGSSEHPQGGACLLVAITLFPVDGEPTQSVLSFKNSETDVKNIVLAFRALANGLEQWDNDLGPMDPLPSDG